MANKKKVHAYTEELHKEAVRRADQKRNSNQICGRRAGYFRETNLQLAPTVHELWR